MSEREARVVVASNRGPVSFFFSGDGDLLMSRGGGGLVSGLSAVAMQTHVVWVCQALSEADRAVVAAAPNGRLDQAGYDMGGSAVRMLDVPADTFRGAYNGVANSTLWFLHHLMFDPPTKPRFDAQWRMQWQAYREYNWAFADALAGEAADGAKVMVQDYHLALVPRMLRERRPDLRIAHFSHTPWAPPEYYRMLPDDVAVALLEGILGADYAGFLSRRWAESFLQCCATFMDASVDWGSRTVTYGGRRTRAGVHGLGVDGDSLRERAGQSDVEEHVDRVREVVGDRHILLRVDRTELSKNIIGGLMAYRELLRTHPEWQGRVVHLAFAYPSRQDLPQYRDYTAAVQRIASEINDEFATARWKPLLLETDVPFPRSLAAYRLADALVVNPIRDGMNLVAKEVPVVSERDCVLVLSREAGAYDDLGAYALLVNPYDISQTSEAVHDALSMRADERAERARCLADAATALPPQRWFTDQLTELGP